MLIIHAQQIHFFFQIDRNLKIGHGFNLSDVSLSVCSGICTIWGPLDFSQDDGNLDEKKCGKKAIRCFIPDKGQGRRMDKNKTDRPPTGLRKEAKWQRRGG